MATSIKRREPAKRVAAQRARSNSRKPGQTATKAAKSRGPTPKPIVIDVHAHVLVPEVMKRTFEHSQYARAVAGNTGVPEPLLQRMTEVPLRLREMDATGVDMQIISPSIMQQCTYGFEPQEALELDRRSNDRVAEIVAQHKDRLIGLGSLPLHDVALSAAELERCVRDLGLRGVIISSHIDGIELGDARLRPFWSKAEELGAVIFIHPAGSSEKRMLRNRLMITVGQPLEEAYALSSLIYEGVMDQFPKLKILVAHGGGYLPFYAGRHDNEYRYGRAPQLKGDFSSYLPRFFYDTVLFNPDMLEFLVTKVPSSHVMLASDYPFAEKKPVEYVRRAKKIGKKEQDAILGANAARLFGITV
ncbi:MAG: amidohydrolase family protein [Xanthobacteraceae bacterium]|jgi:aminocarboxymuconate-semialdehyde decarboxylase